VLLLTLLLLLLVHPGSRIRISHTIPCPTEITVIPQYAVKPSPTPSSSFLFFPTCQLVACSLNLIAQKNLMNQLIFFVNSLLMQQSISPMLLGSSSPARNSLASYIASSPFQTINPWCCITRINNSFCEMHSALKIQVQASLKMVISR
jgi:hypothetical protein